MDHPFFKAIYDALNEILDQLAAAPEMADHQDVMDEVRAELKAFEEDGDREHLHNAQALMQGLEDVLKG
jgi:hypothetical protein